MRFSLKKLYVSVLGFVLSLSSLYAQENQRFHGYSIYGEPKYSKEFTHYDHVNPEAPKGGVLRLSASGAFDSFNPFVIKGQAAAGSQTYLYATLLDRSPDEPNSYYGYAAESLEIDPDRLWVIFHLRPEAQFQDGSPLRAEDVIASYKILMTKGIPLYKNYYQNVKGVEKIDDLSVKFTFSSSSSRELMLILGEFPIFSKKFLDQHDFEKSDLVMPVGSGPYKIDSFEAGRFVAYKRVQGWWGENLPINKGRYNFDIIRYDYFRDTSVTFEAFKSHALDVHFESSAKNWTLGYDFAAAKQGKVIKEQITTLTPESFQGLVFNLRHPLFQSPKVRQALGYALDFEWLNKNIFYNAYKRSSSYFGDSNMASSGIPQGKELELLNAYKDQLPSEIFTQPFPLPTTLPPHSIRRNLEKAQQLLKEEGWTIRNGLLSHNKTQQNFKFEILIAQPMIEKVLLPFIQQLKRLGIEARLRLIDPSQYLQRVDNHDFEMIMHVFAQSSSPGNEQREYWTSSQADGVGSMNIGGIKNPVIDQLVEQLIQSQDRESLEAACRALDRVLLWNHYVIPLWTRKGLWIAYWKGLEHSKTQPAYGIDLMSWWKDPAIAVPQK